MKITGQNVPPQLATKYKKLVATNAAGPGDSRMARTRRSVRATKPKTNAQRGIELFRSAAAFVADALIADGWKISRNDFVGQEMRRLMAGDFTPTYWKQCDVVQDVMLESLPTSNPREFIPSYIYPDETNMPTTPTYPDGMPANDIPSYDGATIGDRFEDQRLVWERVTFDIVNDANGRNATPLMLSISGSISINASHRTCKAFRAFVFRGMLCGDASTWLDDTTAPVSGVMSVWPKVRPGDTAPPYYTASQDVSHVIRLDALRKWREPLTCTRAVVHVAPRALMGKWYNNNTSVSLRFTPTVELWRVFLPIWDVRYIDGWAQQFNVYLVEAGGKLWLVSWGQRVATEDGRNWGTMATHESLNDFRQPAGAGEKIVSWYGDNFGFTLDMATGQVLYPLEGLVCGASQLQGRAAVVMPDWNRLTASADGINWASVTDSWQFACASVYWAKDRYFVADGSGAVLVSFDLINWAQVFYSGALWQINGAGYFNGEYYVWKFQNGVWAAFASADLVTFREVTNPGAGGILGFFVFDDCIEMWHWRSNCWYSKDGQTWQQDYDSPKPTYMTGKWFNNRAVYYMAGNKVASRKRRV